MTPEQKQSARQILKKDCTLRGSYFINGKTCALGALGLAAGVPELELAKFKSQCIEVCPTLHGAILSKFGLSVEQQASIQQVNDDFVGVERRRQEVVSCLDSL